MGWEWRLFYVGDLRAQFVQFATVSLASMEAHGPPEDRTDVYVSCSDAVGAKARGGGEADGQIEIKRRTDRKKRGAEKWDKVRVPRALKSEGSGPDAPGDVLKDVKTVLEPSDWDEKTAMEVIAFKSRTMYKVHEDRFKGIHVECTLVRVDPEGQVFTSICLEHKKDPAVIYEVIEAMKLDTFCKEQRIASQFDSAENWMAGSVLGYPEFSMYIARGRIAAQTSSQAASQAAPGGPA